MTKTEENSEEKTAGKVEELLAKHPNLTKPEALKIITEKNARKREKRSEKTTRASEKKAFHEAKRPTEPTPRSTRASTNAWSEASASDKPDSDE